MKQKQYNSIVSAGKKRAKNLDKILSKSGLTLTISDARWYNPYKCGSAAHGAWFKGFIYYINPRLNVTT